MSEHAWVSEQIAAFVAGGLDAAEAERVEAHLRECAICDAAMKDALALDRRMGSLFASAKPGPALEDRAIRALRVPRAERAPRSLRPGWKHKLAWCAAASVGLGLTGAGMSLLAGKGWLPFPGSTGDDSILAKIQDQFSTPWRSVENMADEGLKPRMQERLRGASLYEGLETHISNSAPDVAGPEAMARKLREQAVGSASTEMSHLASAGGGSGRSPAEGRVRDRSIVTMSDGSVRAPSVESFGEPPTDGTSNSVVNGPIDSPNSHFAGSGRASGLGAPQHVVRGTFANGGDQHVGNNGTVFVPSYAISPGTTTASTATKPPALGFAVQPPPNSNDMANWYKTFNPTAYKPKAEVLAVITGGQDGEKNKKAEPANKSGDNSGPAKNPPANAEAPANPRRLVIRSGEIEFEIESFDSATATVIKLVNAIKGAVVADKHSDRLPNGKMKGYVVVRVPPEALDGLVLDLRRELGKDGELKGLHINSQDITKQYTDIESRLKAARTMEERLLKIIKEGKGEIKQLLEAEKVLGVWRTKIEEMEGEIRYYNTQVSLSKLTITLTEKEIKSAAAITERERIQTGIEVEDVEKAQQEVLAAVAEAKGRIIKSELKQLAAGQFNATLDFECAPDKAGPLRDRLKQIGHTARLEIDRLQQTGDGKPVKDAKVTRGETQFFVQLYNLANMATRETTTMTLATQDVPAAYRSIRDAIAANKGRVLKANLDEKDRRNVNAQLDFEVRRADETAIQTVLTAAGESIARNVSRVPEAENVTDAKVTYRVTMVAAGRLNPRETFTLMMEVRDVEQTVNAFAAQVAEVKGEVLTSDVGHERNGRVTARLIYNVPLPAAASLAERFRKAGTVRYEQIARDPQAHDGKLALARLDVRLSNAELILPEDEGLWTPIKKGLSWSVRVLLLSLSWVVVGLCVVLPWGVVGYGVYRLVCRLFYTPTPVTTSTPPTA